MAIKKPKITKKKKRIIKKTIWSVVGGLFITGIVLGYLFYNHVVNGLPTLEELENPQPKLASSVLAADGTEIGSFFIENRIETNIDSLPSYITNLLIATEDRVFYDHWGVNLERLAKALFKTAFMGKREGASTITQQMAKNVYSLKIRNESKFDVLTRKVREWMTALEIEKTYTKDEILEMYFNISNYGPGIYGIENAAKYYFSKTAKELTISEAAVLIALLKSPVYYNPITRYNNSLQRRNQVLYNLKDVGYISEEDYSSYKEEPIELNTSKNSKGTNSTLAPHFVEHIRRKLEGMSEKYGFNIYRDGLKIYTSIDTSMQSIANSVVKKHIDEYQKLFDERWNWDRRKELLDTILDEEIKKTLRYRNASSEEKPNVYKRLKGNVAFVDSVQKMKTKIQVGFIVLDVKTGEIKTMVGGRDPKNGRGLNHTTQIKRQPGSAFKPIIYTVAIENGLYPAYPIINQPFDFEGWIPHNFDNSSGGFLTLRDAIKRSINLVAGRLIIEDHVKLYQVGQYAHKMGIKSRLSLYPAISLGSEVVTPLELASVYATLGNKGIYNEPFEIIRIEDKDGIIIDNFTTSSSEAIPEETAYIITNMLETVMNEGTGGSARYRYNFYRPAGGKTGTNTDFVDAWFMGFTPQLAAGVWVGFDDQRIRFTGSYGQGGLAALPIWAKFMKATYDTLDLPEESFTPPSSGDVVSVNFCEESIYDLGDPRLFSKECNTGKVSDIINLKNVNLPLTYDLQRDTLVKVFNKFRTVDSTAHEALEIIDTLAREEETLTQTK